MGGTLKRKRVQNNAVSEMAKRARHAELEDPIEDFSEEERHFPAKKLTHFKEDDPEDLICSFSEDSGDCVDSDCDSSSDIDVGNEYGQEHETPYTSDEEENDNDSEVDRATSSEENPALSKENSPSSGDGLASRVVSLPSRVVSLPEKPSCLPNLPKPRSLGFDKTQKSLSTMFFSAEKLADKRFFSAHESMRKGVTLQNAR